MKMGESTPPHIDWLLRNWHLFVLTFNTYHQNSARTYMPATLSSSTVRRWGNRRAAERGEWNCSRKYENINLANWLEKVSLAPIKVCVVADEKHWHYASSALAPSISLNVTVHIRMFSRVHCSFQVKTISRILSSIIFRKQHVKSVFVLVIEVFVLPLSIFFFFFRDKSVCCWGLLAVPQSTAPTEWELREDDAKRGRQKANERIKVNNEVSEEDEAHRGLRWGAARDSPALT